MILLNGIKLAEKILKNLKKEIKNRRLKLKLAVVLVGDNPVSKIYIQEKERASQFLGIDFELFQFPLKITAERLKKEIKKIERNPANSGIVIQLPLPKHIDADEILNMVPREKDVDVLSEKSLGKFYQGTPPILPPVVSAVVKLLENYRIKIQGKNVVIVGAGRLVGNPLALWFIKEGATVSVLNRYTKDISYFTKQADILISGAGKPNLIKGAMIKKGAVVIDAGTSVEGGKSKGDVDFKSVAKKASFITPVPGGVGPLTVACLLENLFNINVKK